MLPVDAPDSGSAAVASAAAAGAAVYSTGA